MQIANVSCLASSAGGAARKERARAEYDESEIGDLSPDRDRPALSRPYVGGERSRGRDESQRSRTNFQCKWQPRGGAGRRKVWKWTGVVAIGGYLREYGE